VQVGLLLPADGGWPAVPMHLVVSGELEVLGTHGISPRSYPTMLAMVTAGLLRPGDLVARTIGLDEAAQALVGLGDPATSGAGITVIRP
jgi:alcohol dehydrogenase